MIHPYTNILACIVTTSKDKDPTLKEFNDKGCTFGKHRYQTAKKRQLDALFREVRLAKRGRNPISPEIIRKIHDEWLKNLRPAADRTVTNPWNRKEN